VLARPFSMLCGRTAVADLHAIDRIDPQPLRNFPVGVTEGAMLGATTSAPVWRPNQKGAQRDTASCPTVTFGPPIAA
jgi:hypothetical protein